MKRVLPLIALACSAWADQKTALYTYDAEGRRIEAMRTVSSGTSRSELVRSVNGREVPLEQVDEKVISDSGGVKVIERTLQRFDANGNPATPDRVRLEIRKEPDGTERTLTTVRRADISGNMGVVERKTEVKAKTGQQTTTTVTVERPTVNAGFDVVERREQQELELGPGRVNSVTTVSRRNQNGGFSEVSKTTAERTVSGDTTVESVAEYGSAATGQMQLVRQVVTRSEAAANGAVRAEADIFEVQTDGRAVSSDAKPKIAERQIVERRPTADGVRELVSVRRALPNEPNRLGELRRVEERICTGDCGQKK